MKLLQTALDSDNVNDITILFDNAKMRRESTIELGKRMQDINDYLRKVATENDELEKKLTNQTTFNPDAVALANEAANIFITALNMSKKIEAEYEVIKAFIQNRKAGVRTCKQKNIYIKEINLRSTAQSWAYTSSYTFLQAHISCVN